MLPNFIPNNFANLAALRNLSAGGTPPPVRGGPVYPVNMPEAGDTLRNFNSLNMPQGAAQPPMVGPYPVAPIPRPMPAPGGVDGTSGAFPVGGPPIRTPMPGPMPGPMPVRGPVLPYGGPPEVGAPMNPGVPAQPGNGLDRLMALRMMLGY